ncbi:MAG: hypothetical protein GQF41_1313 [Candidatus Rifleibacterium amylolyticum]|nr:MAG: hypothetical protein GQF41_1313 [Candidatus Rifleibacterium amylolyticum]NLF95351.1 hypothetical protein [Candidatus Riflebacteria bacterium]
MNSENLICRCCGCSFKQSVAHRDFLAEYGCDVPSLYCPTCFAERLRQIWEIPGEKRVAACSMCGMLTRLCFVPSLDRPVYCQECFRKMKAE